MTVRVRRPDGSWDEVAGGHVPFHERGGPLHVQTAVEPVFYEPDAWVAFEEVPDADPVATVDEQERVFPEGFE